MTKRSIAALILAMTLAPAADALKLKPLPSAPAGDVDRLVARIAVLIGDLDAVTGALLSPEKHSPEDAAAARKELPSLRKLAEEQIANADAALARKDLPRTRKKVLLSYSFSLVDEGQGEEINAVQLSRSILACQYSLLNLRTAAKPSPDKIAEWEKKLADEKRALVDYSASLAARSAPARKEESPMKPAPDAPSGPVPVIPADGDDDPKLRELAAKRRLGSLRSAVVIFYGDKEGVYPETLDVLVPKYIEGIPELRLPRHERTSKVSVVRDASGKSVEPYIKDTGGWLYISAPRNPDLDGKVVLDCSHKDQQGRPLSGF